MNAPLWDPFHPDPIICREDLKRPSADALIIDISCGRNGAAETGVPTTIEKPGYKVDGAAHYVVDKSTLFSNRDQRGFPAVAKYEDQPVKNIRAMPAVKNGERADPRILEFQKR